jgi:hypothetical protein
VDRVEAAAIAESIITRLRSLPYEQLVERLLNEVETEEVAAESGVQYQVEIQGRAFVIADDGSFVGE